MSRRRFILSLVFLALAPGPLVTAANKTGDDALWAALKSGDYVIFLRHAVTVPGIGDPSHFKLGDCSTQRNLSAQGRLDAERIGQAFRDHDISVREVLSSRWCRCIDTAQIAFGRVTPTAHLDSMFKDTKSERTKKARATFAALAARPTGTGNLVLVTHAQNIVALTGVSPASGEMIVVTPEGADRFKVIGRISVSNE